MDLSMFQSIMDSQIYALAIALYIVGIALRKTKWLKNKYIPIVLTALGVIYVALYIFSTNTLSTFQEICGALFTAFVEGVLCAAVAVYANQVLKQLLKVENIAEDEVDLVTGMKATQPIDEETMEKIKDANKKEEEETSEENSDTEG